MEPYKAGIIGLGFIGAGDQVSGDALGQRVENLDGTHAQALSAQSAIALVCGSSRDEGRRRRFEQRHPGVRTYADWRQMLERERLDILSVATYAPEHPEMVIAAAERGVRVIWCEKPIAPSPEEGNRMLDACARAGTLLVINHNRRFNPNYQRLRDLIAAGGLGTLTSVALRWPNGRLGNIGTHMIDALVMLAGQKVAAVSGTLDLAGKPDCRGERFRDPGGWGVLRLAGGLMATVDAADFAIGPPHLTVYGTDGCAVTGRDEVDIRYHDGRTEHWPSTRSQATSMHRAAEWIVNWLNTGKPAQAFETDPADSVHVLEAIAAFHISHERNAAWVELPLKGDDRRCVVRSG